RQLFEGVDVHLVPRLAQRYTDHARTDLHEVRTARSHRFLVHPHDSRPELTGDLTLGASAHDDVTTARVDLVAQRECHRHPCDALAALALWAPHLLDRRLRASGQHGYGVPRLDRATRDEPGEAAKLRVRTVYPLHWQAERALGSHVLDGHRLEMTEQCRTGVPRHHGATLRDVVALERRHGNTGDVGRAQALGEFGVFSAQLVVNFLRVTDEVHLVDGEDQATQAEQGTDIGVTSSLTQHPLARVHQDDGRVGGRRARHHVAGVL